MESLTRSLNYELPHSSNDLHFDQYAQHMLENSKTVQVAAIASTPTITTLDPAAASSFTTSTGEFLQKLGATFFNSLYMQRGNTFTDSVSTTSTSTTTLNPRSMDALEFAPNAVVIDSSFESLDELQKQLDYDKFMNEVWIGIVLTLILISVVFCVCSCFLYHQFRTWKRNYHSTIAQAQSQDLESQKLQPDLEDPVPEYTLVSGLPSYEAALELLHKTPQSCLIVYPSVFSVFNKNEKTHTNEVATTSQLQQQQQQLQQQVVEVTTPLLSAATTTTTTGAHVHAASTVKVTDVSAAKSLPAAGQTSNVSESEKAPSYEQALLDSRKSDKC